MKTELYWIGGPWRGRLAIMPRPRGEDWLEDEILAWQRAGVDVVVSLLSAEELIELELAEEKAYCAKFGVEFLSFPIADRDVPASSSALLALVRKLETDLTAGKSVAIHCRLGVGRSALLAACVLAASGQDVSEAFRNITVSRGRPVPDTARQRDWAVRFADGLSAASS